MTTVRVVAGIVGTYAAIYTTISLFFLTARDACTGIALCALSLIVIDGVKAAQADKPVRPSWMDTPPGHTEGEQL